MQELKLENEIVCIWNHLWKCQGTRTIQIDSEKNSSIYILPNGQSSIATLSFYICVWMIATLVTKPKKWLKKTVTGEGGIPVRYIVRCVSGCLSRVIAKMDRVTWTFLVRVLLQVGGSAGTYANFQNLIWMN